MDSCCFIDMVKVDLNLPSKPNSSRLSDVWFSKRMCDAAKNGDLEIYSSTLTLAECLHGGDSKGIKIINDDVKNMFEKFLSSGRIVKPIMADFFIGIDARDLYWKHNILLSGSDAIHVASALSVSCEEFITSDERIKKHQKLITAIPEIKKLSLSVIRASDTKLLPSDYMQTSFIDRKNDEEKEETE